METMSESHMPNDLRTTAARHFQDKHKEQYSTPLTTPSSSLLASFLLPAPLNHQPPPSPLPCLPPKLPTASFPNPMPSFLNHHPHIFLNSDPTSRQHPASSTYPHLQVWLVGGQVETHLYLICIFPRVSAYEVVVPLLRPYVVHASHIVPVFVREAVIGVVPHVA